MQSHISQTASVVSDGKQELSRIKIIDLGIVDYRYAYSFQKQCVSDVKAKKEEGYIIFLEHKPVFTIGRSGLFSNTQLDIEKLKMSGADLIKVDRGGDITFHGPGQLIIYPIIDLSRFYKDIHRYMHNLEELAIRALNELGIVSYRIKGRTGTWTEWGKICSIGIGISRWVTYHGISINANVDLNYFTMINPCGFKDIKVTSIKDILGYPVDIQLLKNKITKHIGLLVH